MLLFAIGFKGGSGNRIGVVVAVVIAAEVVELVVVAITGTLNL